MDGQLNPDKPLKIPNELTPDEIEGSAMRTLGGWTGDRGGEQVPEEFVHMSGEQFGQMKKYKEMLKK